MVKNNKLKYKHKRVCFVNQWFTSKLNRDYVVKLVKNNKFMLTKTMPKEETMYLFRTHNLRLQFVCLYTLPNSTYLIRKNRKHIFRSMSYDFARKQFFRILSDQIYSNTLF